MLFAPTINRSHTDAVLVPLFKHNTKKNPVESLKAGRPIFDDVEVVEIRKPGSRDYGVYPALAISHWVTDPFTGEKTPVTYAERFSHQYQQFKASLQQTKHGTPLAEVNFLTAGKCAELQAQNIYTIEALAAIDGQELKNLGLSGREWKNQAMDYIAAGERIAPDLQLAAKMEAMAAKMKVLEDDNLMLKTKVASGEAQFEQMTMDGLREYIAIHSGSPAQGNLPRKALIRLAMECRPAMPQQVAGT